MSLLNGLINGAMVFPDSAINRDNGNLLPMPINAGIQFRTPDGVYSDSSSLLPGGLYTPYAYGRAARISTQTQMAHPNRVALVIPKLFIPSPESDGYDKQDPSLDHSVSDGDVVFTIIMHKGMMGYGNQYCMAPYGYAAKSVPIINLPTVNYILWGLQVGMKRNQNSRWKTFFNSLTKGAISDFLDQELDIEFVWRFIRTYIRPLGVQHGSDTQGGQHEGDSNRIVTHGAVDYVSSYAIEGKLLHVNNMWRDYDVHENDDLVLSLRKMEAPHMDLIFNLSSSIRSNRTERVPVSHSWYYLRPEVLEFRSFSDFPYIHIGRSQKYCSEYSRGHNICCWDARMAVIPGAPLTLTFEPVFVDSDSMYYSKRELFNVRDSSDYIEKTKSKDGFVTSSSMHSSSSDVVDSVQASKNLFKTQHALQPRSTPGMLSTKQSSSEADDPKGPSRKKSKVTFGGTSAASSEVASIP